MAASTFTTPAFMTSLAPPPLSASSAATPEPATIKMEDLQKPQLPLTPPADSNKEASPHAHSASSADAPTPSPNNGSSPDSKPKKRKSWGQVLPEPKTNLPPRKRAKTEDEKEQRRIERVKRNRLAAHNSRERKRQEVEALQHDKKKLEDRVHQLEAALRVYQQHLPDLKIEPFTFEPLSTPQPTTPAPSNEVSDTINPRTTTSFTPTPQTSPSLGSMDSPPYSDSQPATPEACPEAMVAEHDETQHSAAMLCDLQCPSSISSRQSSMANTLAFQAAIISLIMFNLQLHLTQVLSTTCSIFHRSMISRAISTMTKTSTRTLSSKRSSPTTSSTWTFPTTLEEILTCSPPQAQHLLLATRLASQTRSSSKASGRSGVIARGSRLDRDTRKTFKALRRYILSSTRTCKQDIRSQPFTVAGGRVQNGEIMTT